MDSQYFFVVFGTDKHQFDRLMQYLVLFSSVNKINLIVQNGFTRATDQKHLKCISFVEREEFDNLVKLSSGVICHGGMGAILTSTNFGKKKLIVPRRAALGEHIDDHQLNAISMFSAGNKSAKVATNYDDFKTGVLWLQNDDLGQVELPKNSGLFNNVSKYFEKLLSEGDSLEQVINCNHNR